MNWYIVQAYSGFENKVADLIKDIMSKNSLESNLGEILVPTQRVTEVKKGKIVCGTHLIFIAGMPKSGTTWLCQLLLFSYPIVHLC